jgi:UDP-glucose 4-epimerase
MKYSNKMKLVVTGAVGHIGSYIVRNLALQFPGSQIVMLDNMMTQRYPSLFDLPCEGRYRFIEGDITQLELDPLLHDADVLIHLAAITDAAGSFDRPDAVESNNYQATLRVAESCLRTDTRLIALSSTSVYGTQNNIVSEDCGLEDLRPQSPYAITKLKEERLITKMSKENGLKAISCRFGTIFGISPGMRFHTAVNKFCWQAVMGHPISVWSTAYDQKRPYLDLIDAGMAIGFIIKNNLFDGHIYNIVTLNSTVREVVAIIKDFVPDLQIEFVDNKIMNQLSYEVSSDKFIKYGFAYSGNLKRGIADTIKLLRQANQ